MYTFPAYKTVPGAILVSCMIAEKIGVDPPFFFGAGINDIYRSGFAFGMSRRL